MSGGHPRPILMVITLLVVATICGCAHYKNAIIKSVSYEDYRIELAVRVWSKNLEKKYGTDYIEKHDTQILFASALYRPTRHTSFPPLIMHIDSALIRFDTSGASWFYGDEPFNLPSRFPRRASSNWHRRIGPIELPSPVPRGIEIEYFISLRNRQDDSLLKRIHLKHNGFLFEQTRGFFRGR